MPTNKSLHLSPAFAISSGTCTLDLHRKNALVIHWPKTNEQFLPKGRKDIGETLEACAVRETFEETGYVVQLLPLRFHTRATQPATTTAGEGGNDAMTEPIAVTQRLSEGVQKIVFWFAAEGDSDAVGVARDRERQQANEADFVAVWVNWDDVLAMLTFEDDRAVFSAVMDALKRTVD